MYTDVLRGPPNILQRKSGQGPLDASPQNKHHITALCDSWPTSNAFTFFRTFFSWPHAAGLIHRGHIRENISSFFSRDFCRSENSLKGANIGPGEFKWGLEGAVRLSIACSSLVIRARPPPISKLMSHAYGLSVNCTT